METITLTKYEKQYCLSLIDKLRSQYTSATDPSFLIDAPFHATFLPNRVRELFKPLKYDYSHRGIIVVKGFPIEEIGLTPNSWNYEDSYAPQLNIDFFSVLLSSVVGEVFGWSTQQKGKIIHDLIPIEGKEAAQTGYGSESELVLHTEDSFHPHKADYVCMYSLRNHGRVGTKFASINDIELPKDVAEVLFKESYFIAPDESHLDVGQGTDFAQAGVTTQQTGNVNMLHGNDNNPYLCFDPAYTAVDQFSERMRAAYEYMKTQIEKNTFSVALEAGDICLIDNHIMVHGREPFKANFDGTDRWLKRINIASDLGNSAAQRRTIDSRLVGEI